MAGGVSSPSLRKVPPSVHMTGVVVPSKGVHDGLPTVFDSILGHPSYRDLLVGSLNITTPLADDDAEWDDWDLSISLEELDSSIEATEDGLVTMVD